MTAIGWEASRTRRWILHVAVLLWCAGACAENWEPIGPDGGCILGTATDPSNENHIVALGGAYAMAYETTNGGASWIAVGEVGASSLNDFAGFDHARLYAIDSYRCYRSTDGGSHWQSNSFPAGSGHAAVLATHPTDSNTVYVAGYKYESGYRLAFWRSVDGGMNWTSGAFFGFDYVFPNAVAVSRTAPDTIYIAGGRKPTGGSYCAALFKSTDAGATWSDISSSVETGAYQYLYSAAVDPTDSNRVYAAGNDFHYSTNAGTSWTKVSSISGEAIAVDPQSPNRIYMAGNGNHAVSTNYGLNWAAYYGVIDGSANAIEVAAGNPSNVLVSTFCGVYRSTDAGATWAHAMGGLRNCVCPAIASSPSRAGRVFVECDGIGVYATETDGDSWMAQGYFVACGNVAALAVHPTNPDIVLALEGAG